MIDLALHRITKLVRPLKPFTWHPIHVAGTNGKGSICAYIAALLHTTRLARVGRFTSPHLLDRWDCVEIDGQPVAESLFKDVEAEVCRRDKEEGIEATEFERLTATAFGLFNRELPNKDAKVPIGVVEVGMGGRLDATNVFDSPPPLVTVISRITHDHQAFLGSTLREIARQKAGIIRPGVDVVVDGTNDPEVLDVIREVGEAVGAGKMHISTGKMPLLLPPDRERWRAYFGGRPLLIAYKKWAAAMGPMRGQRNNMSCAWKAVQVVLEKVDRLKDVRIKDLAPVLMDARLPGRQQFVDVGPILSTPEERASGKLKSYEILLDGAHNVNGANDLKACMYSSYRITGKSSRHQLLAGKGQNHRVVVEDYLVGETVTLLLAFSDSKAQDARAIAERLLFQGDRVITTEFGPVDGMPWVKPMKADHLAAEVVATGEEHMRHVAYAKPVPNVLEALMEAIKVADGGPLVVAGSLYLVSDILRLLRDATPQDLKSKLSDGKLWPPSMHTPPLRRKRKRVPKSEEG